MNMTEIIEAYLKEIFEQMNTNIIEVKRSEIAKKFSCVPSQVNYVMKTKFTFERGYIVESKRGGGGFIRIQKIGYLTGRDVLDEIMAQISENISQAQAQDFIFQLKEYDLITEREAKTWAQAMRSDLLLQESEGEGFLRARLLKTFLHGIFQDL